MGGPQYENVEEAAGSGTYGITVVVPEPFPFTDLAPVLQVNERVVQGRGDVDPLIGEVTPVIDRVRPYEQTSHQDRHGQYNNTTAGPAECFISESVWAFWRMASVSQYNEC